MAVNLALVNANILTFSSERPRAEALAIDNGMIVGIGNNSDVRGLIDRHTTVIDCAGKCLLPGFHDAHLHLLSTASRLISVECGPQTATSIDDIQRAISKRATSVPPGDWIRAGDYDEFQLKEKRHLTRWDLDAVAPNHPVRLKHRSHHACVLNSLALTKAGIDQDFTAPNGAVVEIDRVSGEPTGLLYEMDTFLSQRVVPQVSEAEIKLALSMVFTNLLARGITAVQDATSTNGSKEWTLFTETTPEKRMRPRITMMVGHAHIGEMAELGLAYGSGNAFLRVGAVKLLLTEADGDFHPTTEDLFAETLRAHEAGFPVAIHAAEESTVFLATEAIANALNTSPRPNHHHRIEHASVAPPLLLERMAELGIGVATQPGFLYCSGDRYLVDVEEYQRPWLYALHSMLDQGIVVAAGSDSPVAPADPLLGIYGAVTRRSRKGQTVVSTERVSVAEALRLHTINPATLLGREDELGSIAEGKRADLVLLDADPTNTPVEEIQQITVDMTIVDGQLAWVKQERETEHELPNN